MAPLSDPTLLTAYKSALENRRFDGYVNWTEVAHDWVRKELDGLTTDGVAEYMHEYVKSGGRIDQVPERRPEWSRYDYHYDLRFDMGGRRLYIETRLLQRDCRASNRAICHHRSVELRLSLRSQ